MAIVSCADAETASAMSAIAVLGVNMVATGRGGGKEGEGEGRDDGDGKGWCHLAALCAGTASGVSHGVLMIELSICRALCAGHSKPLVQPKTCTSCAVLIDSQVYMSFARTRKRSLEVRGNSAFGGSRTVAQIDAAAWASITCPHVGCGSTECNASTGIVGGRRR